MKRIQRQRTKGYRMPEGAIYVGRPSRWGNPWRVEYDRQRWELPFVVVQGTGTHLAYLGSFRAPDSALHWAVQGYRRHASECLDEDPQWLAPLRGHDLACWCPLDQPCHADVLLDLANR
jgi:hypothetical protein